MIQAVKDEQGERELLLNVIKAQKTLIDLCQRENRELKEHRALNKLKEDELKRIQDENSKLRKVTQGCMWYVVGLTIFYTLTIWFTT